MSIKEALETAKQEFYKKDLFEKNKKILENLDIDKIFNTPFKGIYKNHINFVNDDRRFFVINPYLNEGEKFISQKSLDENNKEIATEINQFFLSFIGSMITYYNNLYSAFSKNENLRKMIKINPKKDGIYFKEINLFGGQSNSDYIEPNNSEMYFIYRKNDREFGVGVNNKELKDKKGLVIAVKKSFIKENIKDIKAFLIRILGSKLNLNKALNTKDLNEVYIFLKDFIENNSIEEYNGYTKGVEKNTYLKTKTYEKYVIPAISKIIIRGSSFVKNADLYIQQKK